MQRYSKLFGKTTKSIPKDASLTSHKLLLRAGYIKESTAGRYYFLPLGIRVHKKIQAIIKEEMDKSGAQEIITPILHPKSLWEETNRTNSVGFELMTIKDRNEMEFVLGGTAEEMLVDLVRKFQLSYKDLPFNLYQFSTKFRDELRARGGLLRLREFVMKDGYSFDDSEESFKNEYENMKNTYSRIFNRLNLKTLIVESDNGYIGGDYCHEFIVESNIGESKFLTTDDGKYSAHEDIAIFKRDSKNLDEEEKELKIVSADRKNTMEDGVKFHKLPLWQQIKNLIMVDEKGRMILALIRGDYEINEVKLLHVSKSYQLRYATEDEIRNLGSEPGFISPIKIKEKAKENNINLIVIGDISLRTVKNAYTGNNKKYEDILNVNIDRDYSLDIEADIALAKEGYTAFSDNVLIAKKGVEVGNIFQLGFHYTSKMKDAYFIDEKGIKKPYYMGCYGIGIARTLSTIVEINNDERGIMWPNSVAPYDIHIINIGNNNVTEEIIEKLEKNGKEVLWDDREDIRPGEKFADADLIGIPVRIIISDKSIEKGGIELKKRNESESIIIKMDEILNFV